MISNDEKSLPLSSSDQTPPNPIAEFLQNSAKDGYIIRLGHNGGITVDGRFIFDGKINEDGYDDIIWRIQEYFSEIKEELERIAASGEEDPLGLVNLCDEYEADMEYKVVLRQVTKYGVDQLVAHSRFFRETEAEVTGLLFTNPTGAGSDEKIVYSVIPPNYPTIPPGRPDIKWSMVDKDLPVNSTSDTSNTSQSIGTTPVSSTKAQLEKSKNIPSIGNGRRYKLLTASNISELPPSQYRVKDILPREGMAVIFGSPGVSKSFIALDLAFSLSDNLKWFGHQVKQCDVLYICLEGQAGLTQRIQAYQIQHSMDSGKRVVFITAPFSLLDQKDLDALVATTKEANIHDGVIIIDTMSAASVGADENSSVDMGRILDAVKRIRKDYGGLIILIHHSGKDSAKGMRGHSSLLAALDTVLEVRRSNSQRSWQVVKAKDGLDGIEHSFRLSTVELGNDNEGDKITSCVIIPEEHIGDSVRRVKIPTSGNQKSVYDVVCELIQKGKHFGKGGAPLKRPCVRMENLIAACRGRLAVEDRRLKERANDAITGLINKGCLVLREGWLWIP